MSSSELNKFDLSTLDKITITKPGEFFVLIYESDFVEYFDGRFAPNDEQNLMKAIAVKEFFSIHFPTLSGTAAKLYYYKKTIESCCLLS